MIFRYWATCLLLALTFSIRGYGAPEAGELGRLTPGDLSQPALLEPGTPMQEASAAMGLHIVVVEGEDGVNIVKKKTAVQPVVQVRDRNNLPVAGAAVVFSSPGNGPSVTFLNGSRSMTVITDANGRAAAVGVKPVNAGNFQIGVSASFGAQIATATISMTNVMTAAAAAAAGGATGAGAAAGGGLSATMIGVIAGVAAAAAVGIGVGLSHHGGSTAAATPTATIGVGSSGSVGAPH